ncbi:hypothetical protein BV898_15360 [Hypsibius exemplaris]|uniref:Uncharacterized protein n=1 Tax=Hypsibius exemplaris TaxID=2072580 RepID=A0A9X6RKM6_HYPEX|nr:hypothetical protein BV898_15360 [Hypsibius exemplaris]
MPGGLLSPDFMDSDSSDGQAETNDTDWTSAALVSSDPYAYNRYKLQWDKSQMTWYLNDRMMHTLTQSFKVNREPSSIEMRLTCDPDGFMIWGGDSSFEMPLVVDTEGCFVIESVIVRQQQPRFGNPTAYEFSSWAKFWRVAANPYSDPYLYNYTGVGLEEDAGVLRVQCDATLTQKQLRVDVRDEFLFGEVEWWVKWDGLAPGIPVQDNTPASLPERDGYFKLALDDIDCMQLNSNYCRVLRPPTNEIVVFIFGK